MTYTTHDALARVIDYLGAVEVAPGRYAVPMGSLGNPPCYQIATATQIAYREVGSACSFWPKMPQWWTPERQFAWLCWVLDDVSGPNEMGKLAKREIGTLTDYDGEVAPLIARGAHADCITVDLSTGEEVPGINVARRVADKMGVEMPSWWTPEQREGRGLLHDAK